MLSITGCGGSGGGQSSQPGTGILNIVLPHAVLIASERNDGTVGFYDPSAQSAPAPEILWTQYDQGVSKDLTTQAIGLPNRGETATPQFYLVMTADNSVKVGVHKLDCQIFSALNENGAAFSLIIDPSQSPAAKVVYRPTTELDPINDQSELVDEQSIKNLVNLSLFHYLGKNTSPLGQSYTPAIASAVEKTLFGLYPAH